MRTIVFCMLAVAAVARAASPSQLIEGISVGMTVDIGNVTECTKDIEISLEYFEQSLSGVARGFATQDKALVGSSLAVFGKGMREVSHAFTVCGLFSVAERTEAAGQALSEGSVLSVTEELEIMLNQMAVTDDFKSAAKYWGAQDSFQSGVYTGRIMASLMDGAATTLRSRSNIDKRFVNYFA